jgi:hypothetical protein
MPISFRIKTVPAISCCCTTSASSSTMLSELNIDDVIARIDLAFGDTGDEWQDWPPADDEETHDQ